MEENKYVKALEVTDDCHIKTGHKIKLYGKETTVMGFYASYNEGLEKWETIILTEGRGDPFERSLADIEVLEDQPDEAPAADWAKEYDTLYYIVMPVLNKLRHRTDNDTRMMEMGSDIRDTIHKALADIKKLPPPISSNEPPFLVQSEASPAAAREEDAVEKLKSSLDYYRGMIAGLGDSETDDFNRSVYFQHSGDLYTAIKIIEKYEKYFDDLAKHHHP